MRDLRCVIISAYLLISAIAGWAIPIRILHTGDMHANLDPSSGGPAIMLSYWKQDEGYRPEQFLVVGGGDSFPGPSKWDQYQGLPVIDVMNAMGYDASTLGNHENDYGLTALRSIVNRAQFPFVAANLTDSNGNPTSIAIPYLLYAEQGVMIGVVGLGRHPNVPDPYLNFNSNLESILRQVVPTVRAAGAQVVIVITHISEDELSALAGKIGDLNIPVLFGGHSHSIINRLVGSTRVIVSGSNWNEYTRVDLDYNTVTGGVAVTDIKQVAVTGNRYAPDQGIVSMIDQWENGGDPLAAPTARFTVTPTTGTTATPFQVDASTSSDAEDPASLLQVRWDWENDGTWDTSYSTIKSAAHQYADPGTYTIALAVLDTSGVIGTTTQNVVVTGPDGQIALGFQDGVSPTPGYAGTRDTTLSEVYPATNYGTKTTCMMDGSESRLDVYALVQWDISAIPVGSTVQAASLVLSVTNNSSQTYACYPMLRPWEEMQATWNLAAAGIPWGMSGARATSDRGTAALGSITAPTNGVYTITLNAAGVAQIQQWVDNPVGNCGLIFANSINSNGLDFASRQYGTATARPRLVVTYFQPPSSLTPPTARFTVAPATGTTAMPFQVDASTSTDAEEPASLLQVRWDWENDGTWDTTYATTKTATHQFAVPGTYTIALEVVDTTGLTGITTQSVTVQAPATPPTARFTATPATGTTATTFQVDASTASDLEDPTSVLQVRWDWENNGTWDTAYSTTKTASHQYATPGTYTILSQVLDTSSLTGTTTQSITVQGPATPPIARFTVTPTTGTTATVFQVDALLSSDVEDPTTALQVRWDWENNGTWDTAYSTTKTASHQYAAPGSYTIALQVKDTGGLTGTATQTVTVNGTGGQTVMAFQNGVSPTTGYAGTRDTSLSQVYPTTSYGTKTTCMMDGSDSGLDVFALVQWDISAIPVGSTVQSASLVLSVTNNSSQTYACYPLLRPWEEMQATWNLATAGMAWELPGAQGASDRGATVLGAITAPATGVYTITLNAAGVAQVQQWVNNPVGNCGLIFANPVNSNGLDFASRQYSNASLRPRLVVTYTTP